MDEDGVSHRTSASGPFSGAKKTAWTGWKSSVDGLADAHSASAAQTGAGQKGRGSNTCGSRKEGAAHRGTGRLNQRPKAQGRHHHRRLRDSAPTRPECFLRLDLPGGPVRAAFFGRHSREVVRPPGRRSRTAGHGPSALAARRPPADRCRAGACCWWTWTATGDSSNGSRPRSRPWTPCLTPAA